MTEKNEKTKFKTKVSKFHDKHYKHLLLIPALLLVFSFVYMGIFYSNTGDFIHRDISLTGGTTITVNEGIDLNELKGYLDGRLESFSVRGISSLGTGEQIAVVVETTAEPEQAKQVLEEYLGFGLTDENSSIEFTGAALSEDFFLQLVKAVIVAFLVMGLVVFLIFGASLHAKIVAAIGTFAELFYLLINPYLGWIFFVLMILFSLFWIYNSKKRMNPLNSKKLICLIIPILISLIFSLILKTPHIFIFLSLGVIYFIYSIPSAAVIISAFADIFMTLTLLNILGVQMSTAGIIALLMLVGYSVDTDILLTNRVLKRKEGSLNSRIYSAFNTGITMTLTSLVAVTAALLVVHSFSAILTKIFMVLVIGLGFDLLNTWITNVSILKWYSIKK